MLENRPLTTALDWAKRDAFGLRTWPDCDVTMKARRTEKPRPRMEKIPNGRTLERNRATKDKGESADGMLFRGSVTAFAFAFLSRFPATMKKTIGGANHIKSHSGFAGLSGSPKTP